MVCSDTNHNVLICPHSMFCSPVEEYETGYLACGPVASYGRVDARNEDQMCLSMLSWCQLSELRSFWGARADGQNMASQCFERIRISHLVNGTVLNLSGTENVSASSRYFVVELVGFRADGFGVGGATTQLTGRDVEPGKQSQIDVSSGKSVAFSSTHLHSASRTETKFLTVDDLSSVGNYSVALCTREAALKL